MHGGHVLVANLGQDPLGPVGQGHQRISSEQHLQKMLFSMQYSVRQPSHRWSYSGGTLDHIRA